MEQQENNLSIWILVGFILSTYGLIITSCGIYYLKNGAQINIIHGDLNPSLWWGLIMLVSGILFIIFGRDNKK